VEIANILAVLWRRRVWVVVGVIVANLVAYSSAFKLTFPPSFEPRTFVYGAASTTLFLDAGLSPLLNIETDIDPLATRAEIFTRLVESEPVIRRIEAAGGFEPGSVVVAGRIASAATFTRSSRESAAEQRAAEVAGEDGVKRLLFANEDGLPVLSLYATAPTAEEAIRLADAGARGLIGYVKALPNRGSGPAATRINFRQLGAARGGLVNQGASVPFAILVFIGVLGIWCLFVLVGSSLARALGEQPAAGSEEDAPQAEPPEAEDLSARIAAAQGGREAR